MPPTGPRGSAAATAAPAAARSIVSTAMRYRGAGYVYGGTGARVGDWDCSSFVSYVLGHDLGVTLPGGSWRQVTASGTVHGPVVQSYAQWGGAVTVRSPAPGDLVVWNGVGANAHIGFAIGGGRMISAYDSQSGTIVTPIAGNGPGGRNPTAYRRVLGVPGGSAVPAGGAPLSLAQQIAGAIGNPLNLLTAPYRLARGAIGVEGIAVLAIVGGTVLVIIGGAIVVGTLGGLVVTKAISSATHPRKA